MRELVLDEVREGDRQVALEIAALGEREARQHAVEERPAEASVPDLVGPDAGEQRPERPLGHLEPLRADQRDRDRLGEAADRDDVAERRYLRRGVAVRGHRGRGRDDRPRLSARGLDDRAAEHAVPALLRGEPPRRLGRLVLVDRLELRSEAQKDVGRAPLVDHPAAPGLEGGAAQRSGIAERRQGEAGSGAKIEGEVGHGSSFGTSLWR